MMSGTNVELVAWMAALILRIL